MKLLSEISAGEKGRITALNGDVKFQGRAAAMGLTPGCTIEVLRNERNQPVLIYSRDTVVALSRKESEKIQIGGFEE